MSKNLTVRIGENLQIPVQIDDISATTVQFKAWDSNDNIVINEIESFTINGSIAEATINVLVTGPEGTYSYLLIVTYSDGVIEKLPDLSECDEECGLPELVICEADPSELN